MTKRGKNNMLVAGIIIIVVSLTSLIVGFSIKSVI